MILIWTSTFFWVDRWLPVGRVKDLALNLLLKVPKHARCSRLVSEGLAGGWLEDIPPDLDAREIRELLSLADSVAPFELTDGVVDEFRWNWEAHYKYSARSAYRALFEGKTGMDGAQQIWRSGSEEHTSELQSHYSITYAVFCLKKYHPQI